MTTIDRLTALTREATEKPWGRESHGGVTAAKHGMSPWRICTADAPDADFIAEARNALPALLAVDQAARDFRKAAGTGLLKTLELEVCMFCTRAPTSHGPGCRQDAALQAMDRLDVALAALTEKEGNDG